MPRPIQNPPNPYLSTHVDYLGEAPPAALSIFEEEARSILSENESPDLPFRYSINPYRGCMHACAYCYARPSHHYLGWGAGTDFDRKIVVKTNAVELLEREFKKAYWTGETLMFSGVTDAYQPVEASYKLTRRLLSLCLDYRNPVSIITKGALIRRDIDILGELARQAGAGVFMSIPYANDEVARAIEPYASRIAQRFEAIRLLSDAGVSTGIAISPVIVGLSEPDIPELLERAHEAGARQAFITCLRLPKEVLPVFDERILSALPEQAGKIQKALLEVRGGEADTQGFGARFRGQGARWKAIEALFELNCRRLGIETSLSGPLQKTEAKKTFRRPSKQGKLFDI